MHGNHAITICQLTSPVGLDSAGCPSYYQLQNTAIFSSLYFSFIYVLNIYLSVINFVSFEIVEMPVFKIDSSLALKF